MSLIKVRSAQVRFAQIGIYEERLLQVGFSEKTKEGMLQKLKA